MKRQSSGPALRWLAVLALALGAVPLALVWRGSAPGPSRYLKALDWPPPRGGSWIVPGEIAVQLRPGSGDSALRELAGRTGAQVSWTDPQSVSEGVADFTVPAGVSASRALALARSDADVEAADFVHGFQAPESPAGAVPAPVAGSSLRNDDSRWRPDDPRYEEQWNFRMVHAEEAWPISRGKGIVVAVIDTGVAYADTRKGKQARDFNDTSFVGGRDFIAGDNLPNDDNGHGTHVAGTIAESTDNGEGVAGLAFDASIMPLKVLTAGGTGRSDTIAEAIRWAADHGANVINMSLGGPFPDAVMQDACEYAHQKGVIIVCAAGNSGREGVGYPAAFPDCMAVSSVGPDGELAFYSSWGRQIAIAAPGGDKVKGGEAGGILQNTVVPDENGAMLDDYYAFQGTSMASPHVAAAAAMVEATGIRDPGDVQCILQKTAAGRSPRNKYGAGILDAGAAVRLAANQFGDGVARFWFVVGLFAGCIALGYMRRRGGSSLGYPVLGASAIAFGLLFPDWLTGYLGMCSWFNLIGHSVLIPGAMLILGAEDPVERRMIGWMALGMTCHVGWEFLRGTVPLGAEVSTLALLPWTAANVVVGAGMLVSGLTARR